MQFDGCMEEHEAKVRARMDICKGCDGALGVGFFDNLLTGMDWQER